MSFFCFFLCFLLTRVSPDAQVSHNDSIPRSKLSSQKTNGVIRHCLPSTRLYAQVPKSASQAVFSRVESTFHATRRTPHGASRLVKAMSARMITRRAPSRHRKDARIRPGTHAFSPRLPPPVTPLSLPPSPNPLTHGFRPYAANYPLKQRYCMYSTKRSKCPHPACKHEL